jgi:hypothetical protein
MFNRILDVLHKLVNSDKKVHSEIDKAGEDEDKKWEVKEGEHFSPAMKDWMKESTSGEKKRFKKGSELDWMKDKEDTQAKQRKEGVPQKERESFSQTNRFVNKGKMEKCASSCMKKGELADSYTATAGHERLKQHHKEGTSSSGDSEVKEGWGAASRIAHKRIFGKSGDNMAEEIKEEIVKAAPKEEPKVEMTDEEFVQEIVKANLETQTKSLQEFMKAQTDEIKKAVEKLSAMEDRIKKIEEQPIQKAAVVISEQVKPDEGYGALNYKAISRG